MSIKRALAIAAAPWDYSKGDVIKAIAAFEYSPRWVEKYLTEWSFLIDYSAF